MTGFDVAALRSHFPALTEGAAHFDGPGGSQVPRPVASAVADTLCSAVANRGRNTAAERRADAIVLDARRAAADLVGVAPDGVVFGRSMTQLTYDVARTLAKKWGHGDEIVVTTLDHDANVRPWVQAAEAVGATVRWADFDAATGALDTAAVTRLLSERTRVVAVTAASNLLGTRPDIPAITAAAREAGALSYVDGVHLTPHALIDIGALGADFYACSPYKFFGPHLGFVAARPELLETLSPDKLAPSTDAVPERFELGTLPYELLAGTTAAVDFLASIAPSAPGTASRRDALAGAFDVVREHEDALMASLEDGLAATGRVTLYGSRGRRRTPTVLFSVDGLAPAQVHARLAERGVNVPAGTFYALEGSRRLGLGDAGAVRAGIAPYTTESEVHRLLAEVERIAES